jgi:hypothetical protein
MVWSLAFNCHELKDTIVTSLPFGATNASLPIYIVEEESVVDLTNAVAAGNISFTPPTNGSWRIFSFWEGYTNQRSCAGGINATNVIANGSWTVDHFSSTGAQVITDFLDNEILMYPGVKSLLQEVGEYGK